MNPVEQMNSSVQKRVDELGSEIIRYAEQKQNIANNKDLSEADRAEKVGAARDAFGQKMETIFGAGDKSIGSDIQSILEASRGQEPVRERALAAAAVWRQELPGLRHFLEYCAGMISEHPGEISQDVRDSQKCLTEASCVMEKISALVKQAVATK